MGDVKEYYENYWDRDTDVSDNDVTTPERRRRLLETLAQYLKRGDKVLDLGCGGGQFTELMHEAGYYIRLQVWIFLTKLLLKWPVKIIHRFHRFHRFSGL